MPRSSSRTKFKVMQGQTDEERRALRKSFRNLSSTIESKQEELEDANSSVFSDVRGKNNELFNEVRFAREAVLDSINVQALATRAARQVDKLVEVPRYDPIKLTNKLRQKLRGGAGGFDWRLLGSQVGVCFNAVPSGVTFFAGPLDSDYTPKERKKPVRRARVEEEDDDAKEVKPEDVKNQEKSGETLSAVEENIRIVNNTLKRKCKAAFVETKRPKICAINYLFNPKSFTQTVENIFHFSFLLKHGQAQIGTSDKGIPMVEPVQMTADQAPPRQAIVSLTMKDWRQLVQTYQVTTSGGVPHRTTSKKVKTSGSPSNNSSQ